MSIFPRFPHYANIDIGGGYWMSLPEAQRTDMFLEYMKQAKRILAEQQINASDMFIESAVEAAFRQFRFASWLASTSQTRNSGTISFGSSCPTLAMRNRFDCTPATAFLIRLSQLCPQQAPFEAPNRER